MRRFVVLTIVLLSIAGCSPSEQQASSTSVAPEPPSTATTIADTTTTILPEFAVTSPAFSEGQPIPTEYTCDGDDISPQLDVDGIPTGTQTIAILVDDPDAPIGTWTHWIEFDIPAGSGALQFPRDAPDLGVPGINSWNLEGYMGPCPPTGESHEYHFVIYALDASLGLPAGVDLDAVTDAMDGHIIDTVTLTGNYSR